MNSIPAASVPATAAAWSHLAARQSSRSDAATTSATQLRAEDVAQLRARLLKMIVANEKSRKSSAAE